MTPWSYLEAAYDRKNLSAAASRPIVAIPAISQVEPSATGGDTPTLNSAQMLTPPPVSGLQYPTTSGAETRSNYLDMGIAMNAAYTDNILPDVFATPVSDETYSIVPSIDLNRTTTKQRPF